MVTHGVFMDAEIATAESQYRLYDQLCLVDTHSHDAKWWLCIAITLPWTAVILLIWWNWTSVKRLAQKHFGLDLTPTSSEIELRPRKGSSANTKKS